MTISILNFSAGRADETRIIDKIMFSHGEISEVDMGQYSRDDLRSLEPRHDYFVGIDSDGCIFDSMTIKQCEVFHPLIIQFWNLESIACECRETAEFVNLRSTWRGRNRFEALLKTFELLAARTDVIDTGVELPDIAAIRRYVESGVPLGNPSLEQAIAREQDPEWIRMLDWSIAVNSQIEAREELIPPFRGAVEALRLIATNADSMVVSQTPEAALVAEWNAHGITDAVRLIAGQELGTKAEHLELAALSKYASNRILLIGDAPGDLNAARKTGVHFYPIVPGQEAESWKRFNDSVFSDFLHGQYSGDQEEDAIRAFLAALPSLPPWSVQG
jgi:phosphoglycolate phosphatase-like HAD superfamily hydrolase